MAKYNKPPAQGLVAAGFFIVGCSNSQKPRGLCALTPPVAVGIIQVKISYLEISY
jgi:hypothetical protein